MSRIANQIASQYDELAQVLARIPLLDLVAFLTVYTLFRISHAPLDLGLSILAGCLVLARPLRHSPWFWFGIVLAWLPRMLAEWHRYEDHCFLTIYWCAALGLAQLGSWPRTAVRYSARLLIGLSLGMALAWKIVSPQFADGSLFQFKLLFDYRFAEVVTEPIGGLTTTASESNLDAYRQLRSIDQTVDSVDISWPAGMHWLAALMTAWTVLIEGLLAAAFLLPGSRLASRWRDGLLILFMLSTYLVVPVMGFACLFVTLGIAQCRTGTRRGARMRTAYLLTNLFLFAWYSLRWQIL